MVGKCKVGFDGHISCSCKLQHNSLQTVYTFQPVDALQSMPGVLCSIGAGDIPAGGVNNWRCLKYEAGQLTEPVGFLCARLSTPE